MLRALPCTASLLLLPVQATLAGIAAASKVHADSATQLSHAQLRGLRRRGPMFDAPLSAANAIKEPGFCLRQDHKPACNNAPCCCWSKYSNLPDQMERQLAQKCYNPPVGFGYVHDPGMVHDAGYSENLKFMDVPHLEGRRLCCLMALEDPKYRSQRHTSEHHFSSDTPEEDTGDHESLDGDLDENELIIKKAYGKYKTGKFKIAPTAKPGVEPPIKPNYDKSGEPTYEAPTSAPKEGEAGASESAGPESAGPAPVPGAPAAVPGAPAPAPGGVGGGSSPAGAPGAPPTTAAPVLQPGEEYDTAEMEVAAREHLETADEIMEAKDALMSSVQSLEHVQSVIKASPELSSKPARVAELKHAVAEWSAARHEGLKKLREATEGC